MHPSLVNPATLGIWHHLGNVHRYDPLSPVVPLQDMWTCHKWNWSAAANSITKGQPTAMACVSCTNHKVHQVRSCTRVHSCLSEMLRNKKECRKGTPVYTQTTQVIPHHVYKVRLVTPQRTLSMSTTSSACSGAMGTSGANRACLQCTTSCICSPVRSIKGQPLLL